MDFKNCPHCKTNGILVMSDGRCPNCKKQLFLEASSTPTSDPSREDERNEVSVRVTLSEKSSKGESSQEIDKSPDKTKTPERKIGSVPNKSVPNKSNKSKKKNTILARLAGLVFIAISPLIIVFIVPNLNITLPGFSIPEGLNTVIRLIIAVGSVGVFVAGLMALFTGDISYIKEYFEENKKTR